MFCCKGENENEIIWKFLIGTKDMTQMITKRKQRVITKSDFIILWNMKNGSKSNRYLKIQNYIINNSKARRKSHSRDKN